MQHHPAEIEPNRSSESDAGWARAVADDRSRERERFRTWLAGLRAKATFAFDHPRDKAARADVDASLDRADAALDRLDMKECESRKSRYRDLASAIRRLVAKR